MAISEYPSKLSLPQINPGVATVLEYLVMKFPAIDAQTWRQRIADGVVAHMTHVQPPGGIREHGETVELLAAG